MDIVTVVSSIVGGVVGGSAAGALLFGFLKDRWIESVKANYAGELEAFKDSLSQGQKHMQARIDRSIFVSSAQFDTEFDAMKTMYALASKVGILISVIRPVFETRPGNQTEDERVADIQTKYNLASLAFNEFASQIDSLSPFYPVELHTAFVECRSAASTELGQLSAEGLQAFSPVGYRDAMENERAFRSAHQLASTIIRNRLDQLSVVA